MSAGIDSELFTWAWSVMVLPITYLYMRVNRMDDTMMTKEEIHEYVDLKLEVILEKLDNVQKTLEKLEQRKGD